MKANELCDFYCLSYKNPGRLERMKKRFDTIGINCNFYEGVELEDDRIKGKVTGDKARTWSYTLGHFDMIIDFYNNSTKEYAVFCEDDILIDKNLGTYISDFVLDYEIMNLDVLLLGYIMDNKIDDDLVYYGFEFGKNHLGSNKERNFEYYDYPYWVWGAQMYLISKRHAKYLLDNFYYNGYPEMTLKDSNLVPFSSDWVITKAGKKSLVTPLMAIEENENGYKNYDDLPQYTYRVGSYLVNFGDRFVL